MKKVNIPNSFKNIGKISSGTIAGQALTAISLPYFTRAYGAEVLGNWAFFSSIAFLANSISDLGLINLIMIVEKNELKIIYKLISNIILIFSSLFFLIIMLFYYIGFGTSYLEAIGNALLISCLVYTLQMLQLNNTLMNKEKKYDVIMKNPMIINASSVIIAFIFSFSPNASYGYYVAMLLGNVFALFHMNKNISVNGPRLSIKDIWILLKKYKEFCLLQMSSNVIIQLKSQTPTLLIKLFFGTKMLGYYSLAYRLLNMPVTFLANSIGKVYYQKISEKKNDLKSVGAITLKSLNVGINIAIVPITFILCFGDILISLVFGSEFIVSGNILRLMVFYGFFMFLSMCVSGAAIVINKQKYLIYSGIAQLLSFSMGIFVGYKFFNNIYIAILLLSLSYSIIQIFYFGSIFKITNIARKHYLKVLLRDFIMIGIIYLLVRTILLKLLIVSSL